VCRIVKHTIHSAGLRDAVLAVVGEIEAARADSIDPIRVSEEILRRLPKRPYDDSEQPYGLGRSNVKCVPSPLSSSPAVLMLIIIIIFFFFFFFSSLKSDGRGVLLENARPAVGKRPRSSAAGQPARAEATAATAGVHQTTHQTDVDDVDLSATRPSKRSRGRRGGGAGGDANGAESGGGGEPRRTPCEGRRGGTRQRGRSSGGVSGDGAGGQPVRDLDTGLQSVRTTGRPASTSPLDRRRR
jgi:hypothetical protein